ncbi:MAG TPA: ATP-binding cassette domain-containing protein [Polyangiaceae bacterium]|nr:ATP-binding cassette domain-containing protein [Polyangiaceae bacterium]
MIQVRRLYKSFGEPVLRGVELNVPPGRLVGLVGAPASGKSVLLRVIAGLLEPDAGSVKVRGQELVGLGYARRARLMASIGMAFQNIALFDHLTVGENVAFPLRRREKLAEAEVQERVAFELAAVGLSGFEERAVQGLSGGQKRRVGIARAAVTRPPVLLYDEPAAGLDPVSTSRMFSLLVEQKRRLGSTLLVVSSDLDRLFEVTDEVILLHAGRVLCQGPLERVLANPHPAAREFLEGVRAPSVGPSPSLLPAADRDGPLPPGAFFP